MLLAEGQRAVLQRHHATSAPSRGSAPKSFPPGGFLSVWAQGCAGLCRGCRSRGCGWVPNPSEVGALPKLGPATNAGSGLCTWVGMGS